MRNKEFQKAVNENLESLNTINGAVQSVSGNTDVLKEVIKQLMEEYDYDLESVVDCFMSPIEEDLQTIRECLENAVKIMEKEAKG